jgi:hypothetical protein
MTKMDLGFEQAEEAAAEIRVCRSDGCEIPVRLRLLGYDGCEFETDQDFACGERIDIHIYRMGSIRARVVSRRDRVVEVEFDKHCPV